MNHCIIKLTCTVVPNKPWQTSLILYQHRSLSLSPPPLPCPNTQPLWFGQFSQGTQELRLLLSCNFLSLYTNEERERRIKGSEEKRCIGKSKMENASHFKVPWTGNDIWFPFTSYQEEFVSQTSPRKQSTWIKQLTFLSVPHHRVM